LNGHGFGFLLGSFGGNQIPSFTQSASLSQSTVAVAPSVIGVGDTTAVTLTTRDAGGHQLTTGGLAVAFNLGAGSSGGTFGAPTDHHDGTYSATFTGTIAGTDTIKATIEGQAGTSTPPTVQ